ncbi:MAG TPA: peptidylprolyl isomerase [Vicinamibacterales bacterium]|nr:peptidylprolyl isomerase [Vicinamibacterales bacterium]
MVLLALAWLFVQPPAAQQEPTLEPAPGNPVVVMSTSLGDITIELFKDKAPVSVANFLQYVAEGFYTGTIFHRVERGFVVQGGGLTASLEEKPTRRPIQNEATNGLRNVRGTIAMARRSQLRSATSQFYFNLSDNPRLDHLGFTPSEFGYAVFGRVLSGLDVVDKIGAVPTRRSDDLDGLPVEPVTITGVRVAQAPKQL